MSIEGISLPVLLKKRYESKSLELQLKSKFLYYLIISIGVFLVLIASYFKAIEIFDGSKTFNINILLAESALLLVMATGFIILLKGHYSLSLSFIIYALTVAIWFLILVDVGNIITNIDTLFYIFALGSLLLFNQSRIILHSLIFITINLILLLVYFNFFAPKLYANTGTILAVAGDFVFSMFFASVVIISLYKLNRIILQKIKAESDDKLNTQQKLLQSELKFFELTELLPQVVFETDLTGKLTYANKKGYSLFGYTEEDVHSKGFWVHQTIIPEEHEKLNINTQKLFSEVQSTGNVYTGLRKDGSTFPIIIYAALVYEDNKPVGIRGVIVDVSAQKKAENDLRLSELRFGSLIENMNEVVMLVDHEDRVLSVNKIFSEKLGYTPDEIIGKIGYEVLIEPDKHTIIKTANAERKKNKSGQYELTFVGKQGQRIDFLISGTPLFDNSGSLIGSIGILTDITNRKIEERKLLASEDRYRKLFEGIPDIVMVSDLKGNIVYANEMLEKITGLTPADYENPKKRAHIHPEDVPLILSHIKPLLSGKQSFTPIIENRFIDVWGNTHWFSGRLARLDFDNKIYLQTVTRDITEQKKIENELNNYRNNLEVLVKERTDELEATNEELSATNEELIEQREKLQHTLNTLHNTQHQLLEADKMASLGTLSAGIAHEINNPLNFIQGGLYSIEQFVEETLTEHAATMEPMIQSIQEGIDRTVNIIQSLNHFSRQNESINEKINMHLVITNCLTMLQNELKHRVEVIKDFCTDDTTIKGNDGKLHQAILNILSNASQAIPKNGTITIKTTVDKNHISILITDTGIGIKPQQLSQIFNPFFTTKDPGKGTGLGLSITYNIIHEHNGTISVNSEVGQGTTITIRLPKN